MRAESLAGTTAEVGAQLGYPQTYPSLCSGSPRIRVDEVGNHVVAKVREIGRSNALDGQRSILLDH